MRGDKKTSKKNGEQIETRIEERMGGEMAFLLFQSVLNNSVLFFVHPWLLVMDKD